jgi:hypothetical protein
MSTIGPTLHVAGLLAAVGVTAQLRSTTPVNPYDGVTVIVPVLPVATPAMKLNAPLLLSVIAGGGGAVTETLTGVLAVIVPDVPVTVAVYVPVVVFNDVVIVSVDVPAVVPVISTGVVTAQVPGLAEAVGVIAQVSATFPVNPPAGVTVIVAVLPLVAPAWKLILPLFVSAKLGGALTVTFTVVVPLTVPSLPVTVMA